MFKPDGIYSALITPFNPDYSINESELRRLVRFNMDKGLDGIFPVSSVGEALHMDFSQKCHCMDIVVDEVSGSIPVTPGVAASTPHESARLARHAKSIGCPAVVATPPYYFKPGASMVEKFFETIGEDGGLPIILYNIPLFTQPLPYDMVARLSCKPYVVAMKDSSGSMVDFLHFMDVIKQAGGDTVMLTGREEALVPSLIMGAKGCFTASSGIFPEIMIGAYKAWEKGDMETAKTLQRSILPLVRSMFSVAFPVGFKLALELRGFDMGPALLPLANEDQAAVKALRAELKPLMQAALQPFGVEIK